MTPEEQAVIEAARGVVNCMDEADTVWEHLAGGGCLTRLHDAVDALDRAQMAGAES